MRIQSFRFNESLKIKKNNGVPNKFAKPLYELFTSHNGLLFSVQEAAPSAAGLLSTTHCSEPLTPPASNEPSSSFENVTPDPHHAIFPGHPASVADVHQRLPNNLTNTWEKLTT